MYLTLSIHLKPTRFTPPLCRTGFGNPLMCRWRAPEVGLWMDFLDLDDDGQPDSGPTGNENGGRVSYIHYAEPFPTMVDLSHVGYSDGTCSFGDGCG